MSEPTAPKPRTRAPRARKSAQPATPPATAEASDLPDCLVRRVVVEQVQPAIDGGRFPIKRTPGEDVDVTAVIHADGHDVLAAVIRFRSTPAGRRPDDTWEEVDLKPLGNDAWAGTFHAGLELGTSDYVVEAWVDTFASWRKGLAAKVDAGQDVSSELLEGAQLLRDAAGRSADRDWLLERAERIGGLLPQADRIHGALDPRLAMVASAAADRSRATRSEPVLSVTIDRERARFGAWYEMFPRSAGTEPGRGATFREAEGRLADIARMGFDVLYLPPIHPIGHTFRKGKNNTLDAAPDDVGSPWAIGSEAGGHMSVEPALGTLDDFDHFVAAAREHNLEVALDLAYQCSPDHPVRPRASGMVPAPAGRDDQVRRKSAKEISGHLSVRLRMRRVAQPVARTETGD